jgi:hypothetical protein
MKRAPRSSGVLIVSVVLPGLFSAVCAQDGVWKAWVPPAAAAQGEFQDNDPVGLASGAEIKADCSLSWTDPKDHRMYCFLSGTSLETFLDAPQTYIAQARRAWSKRHPSG